MDPQNHIRVSLVATPEVDVSALAGLQGVFNSFSHLAPGSASFHARVVLPEAAWVKGRTLSNVMGMPLPRQSHLGEVRETDILIIPSLYLLQPEWPNNPYPDLTQWILRMHSQGSLVCSACTGAMLLAETGLLDGYEATQHWAFEDLFRRHFPRVKLNTGKVLLVTGESGRIIMSGASAAWHDLAVYLLTRYASPQAAQTIAKFFLLNVHSDGQTPYIIFQGNQAHSDRAVLAVQQWLQRHDTEPHPVEQAQNVSGLPARTFSRRFRQATGLSPIHYVQQLRIERAKALLETTSLAVEAIGWKVGYADAAYFRRLFRQITGMPPARYRRKFQLLVPAGEYTGTGGGTP